MLTQLYEYMPTVRQARIKPLSRPAFKFWKFASSVKGHFLNLGFRSNVSDYLCRIVCCCCCCCCCCCSFTNFMQDLPFQSLEQMRKKQQRCFLVVVVVFPTGKKYKISGENCAKTAAAASSLLFSLSCLSTFIRREKLFAVLVHCLMLYCTA